jgi:hypothetical protein
MRIGHGSSRRVRAVVLVNALTAPRFDEASARGLTDEVKADAAALWSKLNTLYEGSAHLALGYSSWDDYCGTEFGMSSGAAYRVLNAARVVAQLPMGSPQPRTERVARELAPLRSAPEQLREAWTETVEQHGEKPTAKQVREVVRKHESRLLPNAIRDEHGDVVNKHSVHALSASVQVKVNELYRLIVLTPGVLDLLDTGDREDVMRDLLIGDNVIKGIRKALTDTTLRVVEGGLA